MCFNPEIHHRRSIRLPGFDYSRPGAYFVTICTGQYEYLFGEIRNGKMRRNEYGEIVADEWLNTGKIRPNFEMDAFIVMPDHFHGIAIIHNESNNMNVGNPINDGGPINGGDPVCCRGTIQRAPTIERFGKPTSNTIPTMIRGFKSAVTKRINIRRQTPGRPVWQRNYYERIIRSDSEYQSVRGYIFQNPMNWEHRHEWGFLW